MHLSK